MPKLKYNSTTFEHNGYWLRLFFYEERGRWHLEFRKEKLKKYQSLRKADEETAKTEFYRRKLELQKTGYLPEVFDTDLFSQFDLFLDWSKRRSQSKATYIRHEQAIRRFADFIRAEKVDRITPKLYEKYIDHLFDRGRPANRRYLSHGNRKVLDGNREGAPHRSRGDLSPPETPPGKKGQGARFSYH